MASPITWRNVNSRSNADAISLLDSAGRNVDKGFDAVGKILGESKRIQDANYDNQGDLNTEAFKNKLASYATPEALQAGIDSGEIADFGSQLGNNVDKDLVRDGALDGLVTLQDNVTSNNAFNKSQAVTLAEPLEQAFLAAVNANTPEGDAEANRIMTENQPAFDAAGFTGRLQQTQTDTDRKELLEGRTDQAYNIGERDRIEGETRDAIINDHLKDGSTEAQMRNAVYNDPRFAALSNEGQLAIGEHLSSAYNDRFKITDEQRTNLAAFQGSQSTVAQGKIAAATTAFETIKDNNRVNENYAFNDQDRIGITQVHAASDDAGWDTSTAHPRINKVRASVLAEQPGDLSQRDANAIDHVLVMSVESIGKPGFWPLIDDNDFSQGELRKQFDVLWKEYNDSESARIAVADAERDFNSQVNSAAADEQEANDAELRRLQSINRGEQSLRSSVR